MRYTFVLSEQRDIMETNSRLRKVVEIEPFFNKCIRTSKEIDIDNRYIELTGRKYESLKLRKFV